MDSALMLAVTRKVFPEIKIEGICVTFDDMYDETEQAASTASRFDANLHVVSVDNVLSDLPEQINIAGEPRWNLYWCHVVKNAGKFSKMLLTGDGGDELFGGYTFRYKKFLDSIAPSDTSMDRARKYLECHERDWVPDQHLLFGPRIKFSWNGVMELLKPYFDNKLDGIAQVFLADYNGKLLFDWMPVNKKFYEHFSVMGVAPMLNPEVIRFATHLPYNIKYDRENNSGKIIIQNILANKFNFKVSNDKKGFSVDTLQLWRRHGMEISHKYLHDAKIVRDGWISEGWIKKSFELLKERLDVRYVNKMLSLLAFEIWYRIFVTGEMSPKSKI
jgi:asparagine synthase (glutamine-hydrolysing)